MISLPHVGSRRSIRAGYTSGPKPSPLPASEVRIDPQGLCCMRLRGGRSTCSGAGWTEWFLAQAGIRGRGRILELDEDGVGRALADVLAGVFLSCQPPRDPGHQLHILVPSAARQPPPEGAERDHDAVGVPVRCRAIAGPITVFQHAHAIVLHDHAIELRVRYDRVQLHMRTVARAAAPERALPGYRTTVRLPTN